MFVYKISQLDKRISFREGKQIFTQSNYESFHLGQIKLLYSEILFLTKCSKPNNKVLYVGSAEGYHIAFLADMFPELHFDLWDPGKFSVEPRKNITIYNKFFTDDIALKYKKQGHNILFMSDMRTLEIGKFKNEEDIHKADEIIITDMNNQMKWVQMIKPIYAYLKFRLPYEKPTMEYLNGTIYLQPYSPFSTESRLLTNNYDNLVTYDAVENDEKMAYFNTFIRPTTTYDRWENVLEKYDIKNNWDNNYALYILDYYLRTIKNINDDAEVGKLFMDVVYFHKKRYGRKYDIIFNKR